MYRYSIYKMPRKKTNPWLSHVKDVKKTNPKLSLKDVLVKASASYKKK